MISTILILFAKNTTQDFIISGMFKKPIAIKMKIIKIPFFHNLNLNSSLTRVIHSLR
jgi:hypothetical protein